MSRDIVLRLGELRSPGPNDFAESPPVAIDAASASQSQVTTWEEVAQVRTFNSDPGRTHHS
jgi:hypothetical protein